VQISLSCPTWVAVGVVQLKILKLSELFFKGETVLVKTGNMAQSGHVPVNESDICVTLGSFFLESTFKDQINPKRQTAGPPEGGSPELDLASIGLSLLRPSPTLRQPHF
jgi:hypothetical protein